MQKLAIVLFFIPLFSLAKERPIQVWHQMIYSNREVLKEVVRKFEETHPEIKVDLTYRETEELRSAFQSSAMGGSGPDLIYGPSDQVGPFATMGIIQPLEKMVSNSLRIDLDPLSQVEFNDHLYMIGDSVGNHLMLIYNKKLLSTPPKNTDELIQIAKNLTRDFNNDGKVDQYGLVWNMTEPFFFVPWTTGFGQSFFSEGPQLNTTATINAFAFIQKLKQLKVVPQESDYEISNALFKQGKAAMIINGDWSWGDFQNAGIDFGIAPLPQVSSTGLWPAPLVSTKGYSINSNVSEQRLPLVIELLNYLISSDVQLEFTQKVNTMPSRISARNHPLVKNNQLLKDSAHILAHGEPMPIVPELRAVWDALRTQYQLVLSGRISPVAAAEKAQIESLHQIQVMNEVEKPTWQAKIVWGLLGLVVIFLILFSIKKIPTFFNELRGPAKVGYWMLLPAYIAISLVVIYPFVYNFIISLSNLSIKTFKSWQIIGFQNYIDVLSDPIFYSVLLKTMIWTSVNLIFHVSIGLFLALLINQTLPARPLFRTLLIIPWAVPQYITALTWRGLFNQEYGALNLVLKKYLLMEPVQWLTQPVEAFSACILTNIWLGFPFMMVVALGGLQAIPRDLYEAAKVDGANAWQRFKNITWPLLQPVLLPAITLGSIWTFNNLNVVWLVSNSGEPADQTHILVSYVYKSAFNLYRHGYSAALSMIIFVILLFASLLFLKWRKATESAY